MPPADILDMILGNNLIRAGHERRTAQELTILRCVAKRFLFAVNEHAVSLVDRGFSVSRREDDAVDALDAAQKLLLAKLIAADWLLLIVGCARRDGNVRGQMYLKMLAFEILRTVLGYVHCDHRAQLRHARFKPGGKSWCRMRTGGRLSSEHGAGAFARPCGHQSCQALLSVKHQQL